MNPRTFSSAGLRRELIAVARLAGIVAVLTSLTGCVVEEARPRQRPAPMVQAPPPTVVVVEAPRPRGNVIIIREAPPSPRREIMVERERPSKAHIWVAGYWRHDGRGYTWVPGHWERPPRARVVWVEPRWERRDGVYVFIEGTWR